MAETAGGQPMAVGASDSLIFKRTNARNGTVTANGCVGGTESIVFDDDGTFRAAPSQVGLMPCGAPLDGAQRLGSLLDDQRPIRWTIDGSQLHLTRVDSSAPSVVLVDPLMLHQQVADLVDRAWRLKSIVAAGATRHAADDATNTIRFTFGVGAEGTAAISDCLNEIVVVTFTETTITGLAAAGPFAPCAAPSPDHQLLDALFEPDATVQWASDGTTLELTNHEGTLLTFVR
ncbi:MAG TPA: hypothetical protein VGM78_16300 [Ilumatobacteraceae bacterium]